MVRSSVPVELRRSVELCVGRVAGAMEESEDIAKLERAGFDQVTVEPTRVYDISEAREFLSAQGIAADAIAPQVEGKFMSALVRATRPAA